MRFKKSTTQLPYIIDDCDDNIYIYIVSLFKTTYSNLYNSVSTPVHLVDSLYSKINILFLYNHETRQPHITNRDVCTVIQGLKSEKSDSSTDLSSVSLINGSDLLFKCISNVLTIMLQHSYKGRQKFLGT